KVSSRYSSKARLPLGRGEGCHQVPAGPVAPYHRVMPPPFEEGIRPLPIMNAKVARPSGHQMKKPRIISAIQAGFPKSTSFATIDIAASPVNVNHIYMVRSFGLLVKDLSRSMWVRHRARRHAQAQTAQIDQQCCL